MDERLTKAIGKRVRAARAITGLSQAEFAERAKITRGYLSDIERGAKEMKVSTFRRVAKVAGISAQSLLA